MTSHMDWLRKLTLAKSFIALAHIRMALVLKPRLFSAVHSRKRNCVVDGNKSCSVETCRMQQKLGFTVTHHIMVVDSYPIRCANREYSLYNRQQLLLCVCVAQISCGHRSNLRYEQRPVARFFSPADLNCFVL